MQLFSSSLQIVINVMDGIRLPCVRYLRTVT
ncbi:hypothetical protein OESDEN_19266 [Oesophagostomum dentatum]|uniref:Uncharacterized protein n=1 Tax=Oesophagostomum dentatum TaxID=61180 RepID=A0A0B1SAY9_OESDE|nr:hypothetical protein OESDEN_19266 [Oesophagostomum dentatum]